MSAAVWHTGDVFDVLANIPDGSIDLVVTSPPFLALRSYLPAGHPGKDKEIGSEANPAEFVRTLLALTREWRRVLAPHGSIAVELGDTYSGSGGAGGDYTDTGLRAGQAKFDGSGRRSRAADVAAGILAPTRRPGPGNRDDIPGWPMERSLCGIPTLYAWSLAYGRNLLDPADQIDPWRIRNLIAWVRPNPPVGALSDKVRPATSYVTVATADTATCRRWFDLDAERVPPSPNTHNRVAKDGPARFDLPSQQRDGNWATLAATNDANPAGAPLLDWWEITPGGYSGAHYAVFPLELPRRLINLMCPRQVCLECGQPRRRITETTHRSNRRTNGPQSAERKHIEGGSPGFDVRADAERITIGWTDCGHNAWRNGVVLDPFAGSGTTLAAAVGLGRDAIGIDLDERNVDLARERVGMFLTEAERTPA